MVKEAICYETPTRFARYSVSSTVSIAKGTLLKLVNARANYASSATIGSAAAGIAYIQKSSDDRSSEITAALNGTWGIYASTNKTVVCGRDVVFQYQNTIGSAATLSREKGNVFGKALESIATSGAIVKVQVNI